MPVPRLTGAFRGRRTSLLVAFVLTLVVAAGCRDTSSTTEPNEPPGTPNIQSPQAGSRHAPGEPVDFQGAAIDPEDGPLTGASLVWTSSQDGEIGTGVSFSRDDLSGGLHTITLTATDSEGLTSVASVSIEIRNVAPEAVIDSPEDGASYGIGQLIPFEGSGSDDEDGELTGESLVWTSDLDGEIGTGGSVEETLSEGTHTVTLTATDSHGASGTATVSVTVENQPPQPVITSPPDGNSFVQGAAVSFQGSATDVEDGALASGALTWSSDRDGELGSGSPLVRNDLSLGTHVITLTAEDSGGLTGSTSITLTVLGPPEVTIDTPENGDEFSAGATITFRGSAEDPEEGELTGGSLVWTSNRDGELGTGTILQRSDLSLGLHVVTLKATDSNGLTGSAAVSFTVAGGPDVEILSPADGSTFTEGSSIGFQGSAVDAEDGTLTGGALVWTSDRDGQIGTGQAFNLTTLSAGVHVITLTATDSDGFSASASIGLTVQDAGSAPVPAITSPVEGDSFNEGSAVAFQGSANDAEDGALTGGSLVWTSSLDGQIGTGTSFTRSALSVGTHTIRLTATDSDGRTGQDQITFTVNQTTPILVKAGNDASTNVNVGGQTTLPIVVDLSQIGGQDIASLEITVTWNAGVAGFVSVNDDADTGTTIVNTNDAGTGTVRANWFDVQGQTTTFTMMRLTLQGAGGGTTNVSISVQAAGNEAGTDISGIVGTRSHGLTVGN